MCCDDAAAAGPEHVTTVEREPAQRDGGGGALPVPGGRGRVYGVHVLIRNLSGHPAARGAQAVHAAGAAQGRGERGEVREGAGVQLGQEPIPFRACGCEHRGGVGHFAAGVAAVCVGQEREVSREARVGPEERDFALAVVSGADYAVVADFGAAVFFVFHVCDRGAPWVQQANDMVILPGHVHRAGAHGGGWAAHRGGNYRDCAEGRAVSGTVLVGVHVAAVARDDGAVSRAHRAFVQQIYASAGGAAPRQDREVGVFFGLPAEEIVRD